MPPRKTNKGLAGEPKRRVDPDHDLWDTAETWRAHALATGKVEDRGVAVVLDALRWLSRDPDPALAELRATAEVYLRKRKGAPTFRRNREAAEKLAKTLERHTSGNVEQIAILVCALLERDGLATEKSEPAIRSAIKAVNKQIENLSSPPKPEGHAERWVRAIFIKLGISGAKEILSGLNKQRTNAHEEAPLEFDREQVLKDMAHPALVAARKARRAELEAQFPSTLDEHSQASRPGLSSRD